MLSSSHRRAQFYLYLTENVIIIIYTISWLIYDVVIKQVLDIIKDKNYLSKDEIDTITKNVKSEVEECVKYAEDSPYPEVKQLYDMVYEQEDYPFLKHR